MIRPLVILSLLPAALLYGCVSAEERLEKGNAYYSEENYEMALNCYFEARSADPNLPGIDERIRTAELRASIQRGDRAVERQDWETAERAYGDARRQDPASQEVAECLRRLAAARADASFQRGQQLMAEGNPFDAVGEFEQVLVLLPEHSGAARALDRARREKVERETWAEVLFQDGKRARSAGRHEEAIQYFTRALERNPHHEAGRQGLLEVEAEFARALEAKGENHMERQEWSQASDAFREALKHDAGLQHLELRIVQAGNEARADEIAAEGQAALERKDWQAAHDRYKEARALTRMSDRYRSQFETARERLADHLYSRALGAENARQYESALRDYSAILDVFPSYRDAGPKHSRLQEALATAAGSYEAGCQAQENLDLVEAEKQFRTCSAAIAAYRDVQYRLAMVRDGIGRAKTFYDRAVEAERREEYHRARVLLEECIAITTPFQDAAQRIASIQQALAAIEKAEQLYQDACRAQGEKDLQLAQKLFASSQESRAAYKDTGRRLDEIRASLDTAGKIYRRALEAELDCQLERAIALYEECLAISSPYIDAGSRLDQVRTSWQALGEARELDGERRLAAALEKYEIVVAKHDCSPEVRRRVQAIRQLCKQLAIRYEAMLKAQEKEDHPAALAAAREIRRECKGYKDVDSRVPWLESEVEYAEGLALEEKAQFGEAARYFEECEKRTPGFRDAGTRLEHCRSQASDPPGILGSSAE
ncbi:MAG: hypothetical protein JXA90_10250 [Planctomycetes bacterium]|nr:hypothetical protein [Planctomycetota bacterium]